MCRTINAIEMDDCQVWLSIITKGQYSVWPVATETVVLSLPMITGTKTAPSASVISADILSYMFIKFVKGISVEI